MLWFPLSLAIFTAGFSLYSVLWLPWPERIDKEGVPEKFWWLYQLLFGYGAGLLCFGVVYGLVTLAMSISWLLQ